MNDSLSGVSYVEKQDRFEQTSGITSQNTRMEFIGDRTGAVTYFGKDGRQYRGGNNPHDKYIDAHPADVERLENSGHWRVIKVQPQKIEETIVSPNVEIAESELPVRITEINQTEWQQHDPITSDVVPLVKVSKTKTKKASKNGKKH
jgi:hypothetical protein